MFDPYYKWLGIPPKDQPPNHYRLLGVGLFESDADVIDAAANKQMAYIQGCATGPHLPLSQKLLNEIATTRLCLLDPKKKAAYDTQLKAKADAGKDGAVQEASAFAFSESGTPGQAAMKTSNGSSRRPAKYLLLGGGAFVLLLVSVSFLFLSGIFSTKNDPKETKAENKKVALNGSKDVGSPAADKKKVAEEKGLGSTDKTSPSTTKEPVKPPLEKTIPPDTDKKPLLTKKEPTGPKLPEPPTQDDDDSPADAAIKESISILEARKKRAEIGIEHDKIAKAIAELGKLLPKGVPVAKVEPGEIKPFKGPAVTSFDAISEAVTFLEGRKERVEEGADKAKISRAMAALEKLLSKKK